MGTPPLLWVLSSRAWQYGVSYGGWLALRRCIWLVFFFRSVPSSFFRERLSLLSRANCYPQAARKLLRLHYDVFGSGRGTSTLNLQSGLL